MNRNLWLLTICQGLFMTNNVVFIAINGLVGLSLAPFGWMATLPLMAYVVGGAMSTVLVSQTQSRFGRQVIQYQLKEELYNWRPDVRPNIVGKFGDVGMTGLLLAWLAFKACRRQDA